MSRAPTSDGVTKRCYRCMERKPLAAFYKKRSAKDGLCAGCRDCMREIDRRTRAANSAHYKAYDAARDKQKVKARTALKHRIYAGLIKRQPCEVCGKPEGHGHHDDYSKPFDVRWLCPIHHAELHIELRK